MRHLAFITQSTGGDTVSALLFLCFVFPIGKAKWRDSEPYILAKKRRRGRLINMTLPKFMVAFFQKSVRSEASIKKKIKSGQSGNGASLYASRNWAHFFL